MDSSTRGLRHRRRWGCGLLLGAHAGLLVTFELDARPFLTLLLLALGFAGLALFLVGSRASPGLSRRSLLLFALALRVLLLPLPPTLSDDLLRYVWDGRVVTSGFNPYELAPESSELGDLRDPLWEVMPHKDVPAVYPPVAMGLFSIAARLPLSLYVVKAILALADLTGCWLLVGIARRRGLAPARVAAYAWNPLVVLEVAGMGHVDAAGVAAMIAAVFWLGAGSRNAVRAAGWSAVGVLIKLVPAVALPMWSRQSGRPVTYMTAALLIVALAMLPLVALSGGVPPGLLEYAVSWEFNGPLFEPLWRGLEAARAPEAAAWLLDGLKRLTGRHELFNPLYHYRYPQFLAKLVLWAALLWCVARSLGRRDPLAGTGWLFGAVILCSATVYPWYLLWVLPWAALCRQRAWLALSALMPLSYLPQLLGAPLFPWFYLAIWAPFALLLWKTPRWCTD